MTKIVDYKCNFCGLRHAVKYIVGMYWQGLNILEVQPSASENHLCVTCYNAFGRYFNPTEFKNRKTEVDRPPLE